MSVLSDAGVETFGRRKVYPQDVSCVRVSIYDETKAITLGYKFISRGRLYSYMLEQPGWVRD